MVDLDLGGWGRGRTGLGGVNSAGECSCSEALALRNRTNMNDHFLANGLFCNAVPLSFRKLPLSKSPPGTKARRHAVTKIEPSPPASATG